MEHGSEFREKIAVRALFIRFQKQNGNPFSSGRRARGKFVKHLLDHKH